MTTKTLIRAAALIQAAAPHYRQRHRNKQVVISRP